MLNLFTLEILKKIFEEHSLETSLVQAIYFKCLIKHFDTLKDTETNRKTPFRLEKEQLTFEAKTVKNSFDKLEEVKLVSIEENTILFYDVWSKHFEAVSEFSHVMVSIDNVDFEEDVLNNSFFELCKRKYGITEKDCRMYAKTFISEQQYVNKMYNNVNDCKWY